MREGGGACTGLWVCHEEQLTFITGSPPQPFPIAKSGGACGWREELGHAAYHVPPPPRNTHAVTSPLPSRTSPLYYEARLNTMHWTVDVSERLPTFAQACRPPGKL